MRIVRHLGLFVVYGALGAFVVLLVGALVFLESREDLDIWHRADLPSEYTADSDVASFQEYLVLEQEVFGELHDEVIEPLPASAANIINRYSPALGQRLR